MLARTSMQTLSRQFSRSLVLRRSFVQQYSTHKSQSSRFARSPAVFSVVLAVAGLVGWRLGTDQNIALDAHQRPSHTSTQLSAHVDEKEGVPQPLVSADNSGKFHPELDTPNTSENLQTSSQQSDSSEEVSEGQTAFNPETGEINWDCPCLGGMAHGPCGLQFREAFSCFVFSEKEPKGIDCVEKFRLMQECFREHPDVYGEELAGDDEEDETTDSQTPPEPEPFTAGPPVAEVNSTSTASQNQSRSPSSQ